MPRAGVRDVAPARSPADEDHRTHGRWPARRVGIDVRRLVRRCQQGVAVARLNVGAFEVAGLHTDQPQQLQQADAALERPLLRRRQPGHQLDPLPRLAVPIGAARQHGVDGQRSGPEWKLLQQRSVLIDDPVVDPERVPAAPVAGAGVQLAIGYRSKTCETARDGETVTIG